MSSAVITDTPGACLVSSSAVATTLWLSSSIGSGWLAACTALLSKQLESSKNGAIGSERGDISDLQDIKRKARDQR
jgi:hypothetical protein